MNRSIDTRHVHRLPHENELVGHANAMFRAQGEEMRREETEIGPAG